uniref:Protein regulator of cytokinesis 1 n=1 Tax=Lygus hesperus TaxID=30085 RepID=A0A0A9VYC8_LYGHE
MAYRIDWIENVSGSHTHSTHTLQCCELEFQRLVELKSRRLQQLIFTARAKLVALWDELQLSDSQRSEHIDPVALSSEVTDAVLDAITNEVVRLNGIISSMAPLKTLSQKRANLLQDQKELEQLVQSPNRFKRRGGMIRETKLRSRVEKLLPKVEQELYEQLLLWESQKMPPFMYDQQDLLAVLRDKFHKQQQSLNLSRSRSALPIRQLARETHLATIGH